MAKEKQKQKYHLQYTITKDLHELVVQDMKDEGRPSIKNWLLIVVQDHLIAKKKLKGYIQS